MLNQKFFPLSFVNIKLFLTVFVIFSGVLFLFPASAEAGTYYACVLDPATNKCTPDSLRQVTYEGLVPCGVPAEVEGMGTLTIACQLCHFIVLFKNLVDFLLQISAIISTLVIIIAGVFLIFRKEPKAKSILKAAVIGLLCMFSAWLIANLVLVVTGVAKVELLGFKIECPVDLSKIMLLVTRCSGIGAECEESADGSCPAEKPQSIEIVGGFCCCPPCVGLNPDCQFIPMGPCPPEKPEVIPTGGGVCCCPTVSVPDGDGGPPPPVGQQRIVGRVVKYLISGEQVYETDYSITGTGGEIADWGTEGGLPAYYIGNWSAGTTVTLTLNNPPAGYECSWKALDDKDKEQGSGSGCTATARVVSGDDPDWSNHWNFYFEPKLPSPILSDCSGLSAAKVCEQAYGGTVVQPILCGATGPDPILISDDACCSVLYSGIMWYGWAVAGDENSGSCEIPREYWIFWPD